MEEGNFRAKLLLKANQVFLEGFAIQEIISTPWQKAHGRREWLFQQKIHN